MRAISHRGFGPLALLAVFCCAIPAQETPKPAPKKQEQSKSKSASASMKGCVDQQDGQYVLVNEQTMALIANLEADGFPTEGFAKHMGEKVTVRGTSSSDGTRPVFRVRSIEVVSQTCAPQQ
jgi:hypothetical protein